MVEVSRELERDTWKTHLEVRAKPAKKISFSTATERLGGNPLNGTNAPLRVTDVQVFSHP